MSEDARQISEMSERQCRDLLQTRDVGRVAWHAADGLLILPVSYVCDGDTAIFRTSPYGALAELIRPTDVALQVDDLDQQRRQGWTVLMQGRAEAIAEPDEMVRLWAVGGLLPWAPGERNVFVRITPRRITGRMLRRDPEVDARPT